MKPAPRQNQKVETKYEGHTEETLEKLMLTPRFNDIKLNRQTVTIGPQSPQAIEFFRMQERERYKHPEKPWVYYNADGTTSIVGPVAKKKPPGG